MNTFQIEFEDSSPAEADRLAGDLEDVLRRTGHEIQIERRRTDKTSMSAGSTVVLILGTPVAISIANAIGDWLRRKGTKLRLKAPSGELLCENISSSDVPKLVEAFTKTR
jgi:hypothetical protein